MKTWLWYARLENGHSVECTGKSGECDMEVGHICLTQWGPRKVVDVFTVVFDPSPTEPYGC